MKPHASRTTRQSGFTLVEVAIALAIFVIGALAIVRIFPGSLSVVQASGERSTAMNLSRALLAGYNNDPRSLPRAIYDDDSVAGDWMDPSRPGSTVGTANRNQALPHDTAGAPAIDNFDQSGLGHFRTVDGERSVVHAGQQMMFTHYPYDITGGVVAYEEGVVKNVKIVYDPAAPTTSKGTLDFTGASFVVDGVGQLTGLSKLGTPDSPPDVYATADTTYYVTYSYTRNNHNWEVVDEPIVYASGNLRPRLVESVRDEDCVFAQKAEVRYRRKVFTYTPASTEPEKAMCGFVDLTNATPAFTPQEGQVISVNYVAKDWRWVVDESRPAKIDLSGTNYYRRVLPVQFLDGDQNPPVYSALWEDKNTATNARFILGQPNPNPPNTATDPTKDTPKNAWLTFAYTPVSANARPYSRSVYRTVDEWTVQPSVAAESYLLHEGAATAASTAPPEYWRYCALQGDFLYFPPSEAGKTVAVTYSYDNAGTDVKVDQRLYQIDDSAVPPPAGLPAEFLTRCPTVSRLELTAIDGSPISGVNSLGAIRGASVQARTAWLVGERFQQASLMGYRRGE